MALDVRGFCMECLPSGISFGRMNCTSIEAYIEHRTATGSAIRFMDSVRDAMEMLINQSTHLTSVRHSREVRRDFVAGLGTIRQRVQ